ncbi:MAG: hypothetical protein VR65_08470 [Desulfobulbaceae bacterium BRH_c16a]|nr:MAG: hypothetical protein VR65_08470 [Desulfobulbaceae bacterium BRH_c16a]
MFRNIKPFIEKSIAMGTCICGKNTDLTIVHFTHCATVLSGYTDRIATLFYEAAFIENNCTIRMPKIFVN